jgi:hypothetical protein
LPLFSSQFEEAADHFQLKVLFYDKATRNPRQSKAAF